MTTTKTIKPSRPEHTVAVTDALAQRVLTEVRTPRDLRCASIALREGAEQREDAGIDASAWRAAYEVAKNGGSGRFVNGRLRQPTKAAVKRAVEAARVALGGAS